MTPHTDFDKIRALQQQLDEARNENKILKRELGLCQEAITTKSQQ